MKRIEGYELRIHTFEGENWSHKLQEKESWIASLERQIAHHQETEHGLHNQLVEKHQMIDDHEVKGKSLKIEVDLHSHKVSEKDSIIHSLQE